MVWEIHQWSEMRCPELSELGASASAEAHTFVARTTQEWEAGTNRFERFGEAFFVAIDGPKTVGMCGLNQDPYVDDPRAGRLRHLYILPRYRRAGIAGALVQKCLSLAPESFDRVRLRTSNPAADALYRSLGFRAVDTPTATHEWRPS